MPLKVSTGLNQYDPVDGSRCGIGGRGLLRPNPTLQEPRQRGQPLLLEGHGPHAGGYGFCLDAQAMDSLCRGRAKA